MESNHAIYNKCQKCGGDLLLMDIIPHGTGEGTHMVTKTFRCMKCHATSSKRYLQYETRNLDGSLVSVEEKEV